MDPRVLFGVIVDELKSATDQRCPIHLQVEGDLQAPVALDERLVRPVLTNLLANAVKYSAEGRPVELRVEVQPGVLQFTVRDQGCGIPASDLPKLFDPFRRGSNVSHVPGTGLGLAIVRRCVRLHGGQVDLSSEVGVGTTVQVRLPLRPSAEAGTTEGA